MVKINEVNYTQYAVLPIKKQKTLDESLDVGILTLKNLSLSEPFEPFSKVEIDDDTTFFIAKDNVRQTVFGKSPKYEHILSLIEETKELEKYFVDSCSITIPLEELQYDQKIIYPQTNIVKSSPNYVSGNLGVVIGYTTPKVVGEEFTTKAFNSIYTNKIGLDWPAIVPNNDEWFCKTVVSKNGVEIYNSGLQGAGGNAGLTYTITFEEGFYNITYYYYRRHYFLYIPLGINLEWSSSYNITVVKANETDIKIKKTLLDVVNKLLYRSETQRLYADSKYAVSEEAVTLLSSILAPEMTFTNCTLREALNVVGSYIHREVRLKNNIIYFDKLTSTEYANINKNHSAYTASQDIEQFCNGIESNVKNLVTDYKENEGNIVEPFIDGYKTLRTETGIVRVDESNAFIETNHRVERIIKVECGFLSDEEEVGDITKYVVGKPVYDSLSSYSETPSESKAFHIYYEQGRKHIKGLNFKLPNVISDYFSKYAITNILNHKLNKSYNDGSTPFIKLNFRITYEAIIDGRFKQFKPYLLTNKKYMIAYNQSANKVSSTLYGENLKGAVARLGNVDKVYTYTYKNGGEAPKAGQLFDKDYYINIVATEKYRTYAKVSLGLSKDFNKLNENIGIKKEQRFYEIPEDITAQSYINYDDFLIIGNSDIEENDYDKSLVHGNFLEAVKLRFKNGVAGNRIYEPKISCMRLNGIAEDLTIVLPNVVLPTINVCYGNSISYLAYFANNYGAGNYLSYNEQSDGKYLGRQQELRYSDNYGEFEYLDFGGFSYHYDESLANFDDAVIAGNAFPNITGGHGDGEQSLFSTVSDIGSSLPIIVKKGSGEQILLNYGIHCITNNRNIVVGSGLPRKLMALNYAETDFVDIYVMNREIGKFEKEILDLPSSDKRISYSMSSDSTNKQLNFGSIILNASGKSIVLVDRETKELIFAINEEVSNGQTYQLPSLCFRHKI